MRLTGKVAIVTGAGRGIGAAIARKLAQEGAKVVVNYGSSAEAASRVVAEIEAAGGMAIAVQASVADQSQVDSMVKQAVDSFGTIDILVNNAGITRDKLLLRMNVDDWDDVLNTNLRGAFLCLKAVAPILIKKRSGAIVNVGSVIGRVGQAGQINYSASKAGLVGLTKSAAKEFGSRNVRVNAVAPGFIESDMTEVLKPEFRDAILKQIPLARFGAPDDVARVVAFLCSDDAGYVQGEVISIDGGLFM